MNSMIRQNCWEFNKCGRERGGTNSLQEGICPTADENRLNNANAGLNAGRSCWVIAGSFCGRENQGKFVEKFTHCVKCDFYKLVKTEQDSFFTFSGELIKLLK